MLNSPFWFLWVTPSLVSGFCDQVKNCVIANDNHLICGGNQLARESKSQYYLIFLYSLAPGHMLQQLAKSWSQNFCF